MRGSGGADDAADVAEQFDPAQRVVGDAIQRSGLWAMAAITVQAPLA